MSCEGMREQTMSWRIYDRKDFCTFKILGESALFKTDRRFKIEQ